MTHKYFEIKEEVVDTQTEVPNIIRLDVVDDAEATALYQEHKDKFKTPKAMVVDGDHKNDGTSKPCRVRKIKEDGTIEAVISEKERTIEVK